MVSVFDSVDVGVSSNPNEQIRVHIDAGAYARIRINYDRYRRGVGDL
jgi:hypothetical protein